MKLDQSRAASDLTANGYTTLPLLDPTMCRRCGTVHDDETGFRSRVVMARHGFGQGEYKYRRSAAGAGCRAADRALSPARRDRERVARHAARGRPPPRDARRVPWRVSRGGSARPTRCCCAMDPDDFNCLHQDLYGPLVFPLQVTVLRSAPGADFAGGEFVLVEQRPRAQSRPTGRAAAQGEAVIFPVHHRPLPGARGPASRHHAPRRQPRHRRRATDPRHHLPRRHVKNLLLRPPPPPPPQERSDAGISIAGA